MPARARAKSASRNMGKVQRAVIIRTGRSVLGLHTPQRARIGVASPVSEEKTLFAHAQEKMCGLQTWFSLIVRLGLVFGSELVWITRRST